MEMNEVLKIKTANLSRYSNSMHAMFHRRVYDRMKMIAYPEKFHIENYIETYNDYISKEEDRTREGSGSGKTLDLNDINKKRTDMLPFFSGTLEIAQYSPLEEVRAAGRALLPVYNPYKSIQSAGNHKKTQMIRSMIYDFKKDENINYTTALNLIKPLEQLQLANEEYASLTEDRLNESISNKLDTSKNLRKQTDDLYFYMCDLIYASELLETEPDNITLIKNFIEILNGIIDEMKTSVNMSIARKKASKSAKNTAKKTKTLKKSKKTEEKNAETEEKTEENVPVAAETTDNQNNVEQENTMTV